MAAIEVDDLDAVTMDGIVGLLHTRHRLDLRYLALSESTMVLMMGEAGSSEETGNYFLRQGFLGQHKDSHLYGLVMAALGSYLLDPHDLRIAVW